MNLPAPPAGCCEGTNPTTGDGGGTTGPGTPNFPGGTTTPDPPDLPSDMLNKTAGNTTYPNHLNRVRLENGWQLYALNEELALTPDDCFEVEDFVVIENDSTPLLLPLPLQAIVGQTLMMIRLLCQPKVVNQFLCKPVGGWDG